MSPVLLIGDGNQDSLLIRVTSNGFVGWGEAVSSPLTRISSWIAPMSHSGCQPVINLVLGERVDSADDIRAISKKVRTNSFYGILQSGLPLSGIEIALWDLLGKVKEEPIFRLLGYQKAEQKVPYASVLFGDTPEETLKKAEAMTVRGFQAMKFGWGPFGRSGVEIDEAHIFAAREGMGSESYIMIDAGTIFDEDVDAAAVRLAAMSAAKILWYEEPFTASALSAYKSLSLRTPLVKLAGGINDAYQIAKYATAHGMQYVNHTFTSQLALSASL
jgi:L-alanine-DL-glutamate epimerase-like enolase superfamily enzyme